VKTVIAPSILASDWGKFREEVQAVVEAGADWIHIDVMDGQFVPPITFGPDLVKALRKSVDVPLDVHLMIENPENQISAFRDAGADIITVHQEVCHHLHRTLQSIGDSGAKAGVAINPSTPVSSIEDLKDLIDLVCIMSVNPGWGGQSFIEKSFDKIKQARSIFGDKKVDIEVDGGVNASLASEIVSAGANILVAGTAVFGKDDYRKAVQSLRTS